MLVQLARADGVVVQDEIELCHPRLRYLPATNQSVGIPVAQPGFVLAFDSQRDHLHAEVLCQRAFKFQSCAGGGLYPRLDPYPVPGATW